MSLTPDRLREVLDYDAATGTFTWRVTRRRIHVGDVAGSVQSHGYRAIQVDGRFYKAHRLAWLYVHDRWPAAEIDHINGVKDDNRLLNLREVTRSENQHNRWRARSDNRSCGLLGVRRNRSGWQAHIAVDGRERQLGTFTTPELAHAAYLAAKRVLHPSAIPAFDRFS